MNIIKEHADYWKDQTKFQTWFSLEICDGKKDSNSLNLCHFEFEREYMELLKEKIKEEITSYINLLSESQFVIIKDIVTESLCKN
jgi:predicted house-cleaning noncanonical NTP pyrophosphatase (MazG superfamily)